MAEEYNFGKVPMSVCVIKPDAVQGGIMQEILSELEKRGFILLQQDMQMMTTTKARGLYLEHEKADFFKSLIGFMTSGPINAVLLTHSSSPDPVAELQGAVGPTNSEKARADAPESLRAMFGTDGMRNAVHAPANQAAAVNAIKTLFPLALEEDGADTASAEQPTDELVEVITAGLAELCRMKPPNPAEWLAEWMIANRDPEKRARKKKLAETYAMQQ